MTTAQSLAIVFLIFWVLSGIHWFNHHAYHQPKIGCYMEATVMGLVLAVCESIIGLVAVGVVLTAFGQL